MANVPSNLIPSRITQLPEAPVADPAGYFPIVISGTTYKVQFSQIQGNIEVPASRIINAGTGLTGGGSLSADITIAVANGGIGDSQLDTTGVSAGTYGDGANVPVVTVNPKGRVTSVSTTPLTISGYVPDSRQIVAGSGLIGGGNLSADRTLAIDFSSALPQSLGPASAGTSSTAARDDHVHPALDLSDGSETTGTLPMGRGGTGANLSPVAGAVLYSTGSQLAVTTLGLPGQVLISNGTAAPSWLTVTGVGTVTSVDGSGGTTGMTLGGGPITGAGTLTLGGTLSISSGGTGASTQADARTNLGLGTMAVQDANSVSISNGSINVTSLGATSGNVTTLTSSSATITDLSAGIGDFTTMSAVSANVTTLTGTSWTVTNLTATSATISNFTFTSSTVTDLTATNFRATSGNITTLTGTTFGATATTQLRGASGQITQLNSTSATITTLTSSSAGITTLSGTTATYTSATITNLALTSLTLANLNIGSANVTTLTGTNLTYTSGTVTNLNSTSANIATLTGTTFGTTATTQLRGASGQISQLNSTSATISTLTGTSASVTNLSLGSLVISSTTLVTNLNADLLDGQTGSYYQNLANATGIISGGAY